MLVQKYEFYNQLNVSYYKKEENEIIFFSQRIKSSLNQKSKGRQRSEAITTKWLNKSAGRDDGIQTAIDDSPVRSSVKKALNKTNRLRVARGRANEWHFYRLK